MSLLESMFIWFMASTLRGTLLALAVLLVQKVFSTQMPARVRYALWLPLILVLLIPFLPHIPWNLPHPIHPASSLPVKNHVNTPAPSLTLPAQPFENTVNGFTLVMDIWLAGMGIYLMIVFKTYSSLLGRLLKTQYSPAWKILTQVAVASQDCGLSSPPRVVVSSAVNSPAVIGLLKPILLLPPNFPGHLTPEETKMVLLHEMMHLKRNDLLFNWGLFLIQALHWCNPVIWLALNQLRLDREAACDEHVLSMATSGTDYRFPYAHALLKLSTLSGQNNWSLAMIGILNSNRKIRSRLHGIANYRPMRPLSVILGVSFVTLLSLIALSQLRAVDITTLQPHPIKFSIYNGQYHITRSVWSTTPIKFSVNNELDEPIGLYWINFEGQLVYYQTIASHTTGTQSSFITHPWVIQNVSGRPLTEALFPAQGQTLTVNPLSVALNTLKPSPTNLHTSYPVLKSSSDALPITLTIHNGISQPALVYWINYAGNPVFYGTMDPDETIKLNTYVSYPWVITDLKGNQLGNVLVPKKDQTIELDPLWASASTYH